ncbi:Pyridoxine 4-dehydrogenase [Pseudogymnoascus destructans]|uniref:Pyridoxine 4-dehydrogenase n=1 Tax=Pseudogymnoascus destructans TaxID=655981 RepID=A0A177AMW3_9PEZI|nr:Pyridoxine 4-dehydrogenase [Pseudogymnoascus destructans]OAF62822.1 Pyridoxine 4-dehydrogenase [Pseudogymnoascus destructans]
MNATSALYTTISSHNTRSYGRLTHSVLGTHHEALEGITGSNFLEWRRLYGTHYYSLHLLAAYFTKYPEDANKVVLSIKSGFKTGFEIDGNPEHVRDRVNNCNRILAGTKKIDIFEYARVPTNVDFFSVTLKELQKCVEGLIGGIGLSEVTAATINKSAAIAKIDAVYSPLGRGMFTGQIKSADDISEGDFRRRFPRFQQENFHHNIELVQRLQEVSNRSRCTPGQLAIAWVRQAGKTVKRSPQILPIPGATRKERVVENCKTVTLDKSALAHIEKVESIRIGTGSNMTVVIYLHIS